MSLRQKRREVQQFVTIVQGVLSCRKTEKMLELVADDHQILLEMGCNALPTFLDKDPQRRRCKSGFFWFLTLLLKMSTNRHKHLMCPIRPIR